MRRSAIAVSAVLLLAASPQGARAAQLLIDLRQVAVDTLSDVAMAAIVDGRPVIYFNPGLLQRLGPLMTEFFFAHEYGHIHDGHTGGALAEGGELSLTRQRQELEADCYAAELLGATDPEAVQAALRFFTGMGPYRYDIYHPTGSQRAAKILACLPESPAALLPG
jgi:Zn-dependent protease with chaperone function